jgi:hypothetical protein
LLGNLAKAGSFGFVGNFWDAFGRKCVLSGNWGRLFGLGVQHLSLRGLVFTLLIIYDTSFTYTLGILTEWVYLPRLETRTKESNMYASFWVFKPMG